MFRWDLGRLWVYEYILQVTDKLWAAFWDEMKWKKWFGLEMGFAEVISPPNGGEFCCRHISISLRCWITLRTHFPQKLIIYVCCSWVAFAFFCPRLLSCFSLNALCCFLVDDFPECNVLKHQKSAQWFSLICFFSLSFCWSFHLYVLSSSPRLSLGLWCSGFGII